MSGLGTLWEGQRLNSLPALIRARPAEHQGGVAEGMAPIPETPPTNAPLLPSWSPYKAEDGSWGLSFLGESGKTPQDLAGFSIEITPRRRESWTATVLEVIERREDFVQVRDSGRPSDAA